MRSTRMALAAIAAAGALTLSACAASSPDDTTDTGAGGETTASGDATDGAAAGDTIRIGIKFDQPGLGFQDGSEYRGFDVDVATYVTEALGYSADQIEWVESPSAQRENLLAGGQVDMIFATYSITDSRRETVSFAGPYFVAGQDLLVRTDETDIAGPEDLEGRNLCSVTGSTSAERIKTDYAEGVQLVEQPSYAECVGLLRDGTVDAVTTDDIILAGLAAQEGNAGQVRVVGNPFSTENYGVGIPKGDVEICEQINAALTTMVEDGSWDEAVTANTEGTGYTPNAETNPPELMACS